MAMGHRDLIMALPPTMRYRRQIDGADFSLEANTEAVPEEGHFYLLRKGRVEYESDDFPAAMEAYQKMCRRYWTRHLGSSDHEERMASAWGLVNLDPDNRDALTVIREEGQAEDRKRLEQLRRRKQAAARAAR